MKTDVIQTSFVGGEFGPSLLGRSDISQYSTAAALIQNWLVRPYGSIISTPGTEFINQCVTGGSTTLSGVRLIPFKFSESDAYIIEMGVGYFSFYTNGAVVVSPGTTPYQVAHSYAAADIPSIQYCQDNDVIYLFHDKYPPQTLIRMGATNWALTNFPFTGGPFMAVNTGSTIFSISSGVSGASISISTSAALFTVSNASTTGHNGTFWALGTPLTNSTTAIPQQGYIQITTVTNPTTATAVVVSLISGPTNSLTIWQEGSWSAVRGWPARCAFFQSRLFAARTVTEPQTVWGSQNFVFNNFSVNSGNDDDALNLQLAATESNDIKWLAPMNDLIVGTYGGEFCITAGLNTGNPLTPSTVSAIQQTSWGSESIIPRKIGNFAYYVQRYAQKLREISYEWLTATYKAVDKTILSPQVSGGGFVDMAYQQNPDTILWLVCSNGTLATLTREVDQQVQGWARQVTQGNFISIASIPSQSDPHDEVWVIAQRVINEKTLNYVERFASQIVPTQGFTQIPQQDQCFYVHCGSTYSAFSSTSGVSISLNATAGTVIVTSSSAYFTSANVGERIRAVDAYDNVLGEMLITGYTSSTVVVGTVSYPFSAVSYSSTLWGVSVQTISGLGYLEQATVVVLADGGVDNPAKVVSNGSIPLSYNYFVVTVGLQAVQKILTLPREIPQERGTAQGKKQRINNVAFRLNNSYTGFSIAGTSGTLFPIQFRATTQLMGTTPLLFTGVVPNLPFKDDYRYGAQVLIQNNDPLPIEILNIITTVETFSK